MCQGSMVRGNPGPWFICGVKSKSVLWASLVHLVTLFPELGTFTATVWMMAEAVDTFIFGQWCATVFSLVCLKAFSTVCSLVVTVVALVFKLVSTKTLYHSLCGHLSIMHLLKTYASCFRIVLADSTSLW